jgi:hypothetical protein
MNMEHYIRKIWTNIGTLKGYESTVDVTLKPIFDSPKQAGSSVRLTDFFEADDSMISPCHRCLLWKWKGRQQKKTAVRGEMPWFPPGSESEIRAYKGAVWVSSDHRRTSPDMKLVSRYLTTAVLCLRLTRMCAEFQELDTQPKLGLNISERKLLKQKKILVSGVSNTKAQIYKNNNAYIELENIVYIYTIYVILDYCLYPLSLLLVLDLWHKINEMKYTDMIG